MNLGPTLGNVTLRRGPITVQTARNTQYMENPLNYGNPDDDTIIVSGVVCPLEDYAKEIGTEAIPREQIEMTLRELNNACSLNYRHMVPPIGFVTNGEFQPQIGFIIKATICSRAQVQNVQKSSSGKGFVVLNKDYMEKYEKVRQDVMSGKIGQFSISFSKLKRPDGTNMVKVIDVAITEKGNLPVGDFHYVKYSGTKKTMHTLQPLNPPKLPFFPHHFYFSLSLYSFILRISPVIQ